MKITTNFIAIQTKCKNLKVWKNIYYPIYPMGLVVLLIIFLYLPIEFTNHRKLLC